MYKTKDGLTYELILQWIEAGRVVIANVLEGHHFVLSVGGSEDGDTIEVHDPGDLTALPEHPHHPPQPTHQPAVPHGSKGSIRQTTATRTMLWGSGSSTCRD